MHSRTPAILTIFLLATLTCLCMISCAPDAAPTPGNTENQREPTDDSQALNEDTYRNEITAIAIEIENAIYGLDQLLAAPEIESDDWLFTATLVLTDITALCDEASQIEPPESMADVHVTYLEAIDRLDDAVALFAEGLDKTDIDLVNQAAAEIWLATEILSQVIE